MPGSCGDPLDLKRRDDDSFGMETGICGMVCRDSLSGTCLICRKMDGPVPVFCIGDLHLSHYLWAGIIYYTGISQDHPQKGKGGTCTFPVVFRSDADGFHTGFSVHRRMRDQLQERILFHERGNYNMAVYI